MDKNFIKLRNEPSEAWRGEWLVVSERTVDARPFNLESRDKSYTFMAMGRLQIITDFSSNYEF